MANIIVGTAGHIDHGKTSLVKALTGTDTDRLREEKERGITIDIGFASLAVDAETTIGFVDVPGHERFVKNMLAGVGGIDLVLLVIAADESVMPQTREHLAICSLLRIPRGVTVLTKIDAADPELADLAEVEAQELVKGTFLEGAPVIRVSAATGEGIPRLVSTLSALARETAPRGVDRVFRLPIDRAFTMRGFGTVVSGTLVAGTVARDAEVELLPTGQGARVRGVQVHGRAVDEARAGQRTALNLQRVDLTDVARGMVLAPPGVFTASRVLDVHLELLASAPSPVDRRKRVRFHAGTAELIGHVVLLGRSALQPGESGYAQVLLESPAFVLPGDRFILRQYSPMTTIGGGEVLDGAARRHRPSDPAAVRRLEALHRADLEDRVMVYAGDAGERGIDVVGLVGRTGVPPARLRPMLDSLATGHRVRVVADQPFTVVTAGAFASVQTRIVEELARFHGDEPLMRGVGRDELKARAAPGASLPVFRAALEDLAGQEKVAVDQDLVRRFDHRRELGAADAAARDTLRERFRAAGLQPPGLDEVVEGLQLERTRARKILQLMIDQGELVRVADDLAVDAQALQQLVDDVKRRKAVGPTLGVREFKDLTGLTRKFAVPLLEYLDAQRITRRVGEDRIIL